MPIIIDGYNLLNVAGVMPAGHGPGTLEKARQALLNVLVESLPADDITRTTVVFDASDSPWGVAKQNSHRGIMVLFAPKDADADTLIEELIKADSAPKRLTVVSSDHRIQRAAKRRRSIAVDSDVWFANLLRERAARTNTGADAAGKTPDVPKPQGPFAPGEVEHWLRMFGLEE